MLLFPLLLVLLKLTRLDLDILFDLYTNSNLNSDDIELEKQVVVEEINMYEDTPDDNIHDIFLQMQL